jgi:hypothetical protein
MRTLCVSDRDVAMSGSYTEKTKANKIKYLMSTAYCRVPRNSDSPELIIVSAPRMSATLSL